MEPLHARLLLNCRGDIMSDLGNVIHGLIGDTYIEADCDSNELWGIYEAHGRLIVRLEENGYLEHDEANELFDYNHEEYLLFSDED